MARKNTHYVVWEGNLHGVYDSWEKCKQYIEGYSKAKYKGFSSKLAAEQAFAMGYENYKKLKPEQAVLLNATDNMRQPVYPSWAVDAAWNTATREMEYRGVDAQTGQEIFRQGPFPDATNNIGEFLAIVHALALLQQQGSTIPVYTDSLTAISWVRAKQARTKLNPTSRNQQIFELVKRAEKWLKTNTWGNKLLKWETHLWGEIPADFGRK